METTTAFYSQVCNLDCPKESYKQPTPFPTLFTLNTELQARQFEFVRVSNSRHCLYDLFI